MLGLEANRTVTADRLIEGLWGEEPPPSAAKMVQNYVWRLRRRCSPTAARRSSRAGAATSCGSTASCVDVCRFERLVAEAARAADGGEPGDAAREALALFRGEPLADLADEPFAGRGDPPARGAAPDRGGAGDRRRPRRGPPPGGRRRDRRAAGREPAARAAARAADARALPLRAPGRGARGLPARAAHAGRGDRRRAGRRSCGACTRRSCARTRRWTSSRPRPSSRASSTPRRRRR